MKSGEIDVKIRWTKNIEAEDKVLLPVFYSVD